MLIHALHILARHEVKQAKGLKDWVSVRVVSCSAAARWAFASATRALLSVRTTASSSR